MPVKRISFLLISDIKELIFRQNNSTNGSLPDLAGNLYFPVMHINDFFHYCQAKSVAAHASVSRFVGHIKPFKNVKSVLVCHSYAVVFNRKIYKLLIFREDYIDVPAFGSKFNAVLKQINPDLTEKIFIGVNIYRGFYPQIPQYVLPTIAVPS